MVWNTAIVREDEVAGRTVYTIRIVQDGLEWQVRKYYTDFVTLDQNLAATAAVSRCALPPKGLAGIRHRLKIGNFNEQRVQGLSVYLQHLAAQVPTVNHIPVLQMFFTQDPVTAGMSGVRQAAPAVAVAESIERRLASRQFLQAAPAVPESLERRVAAREGFVREQVTAPQPIILQPASVISSSVPAVPAAPVYAAPVYAASSAQGAAVPAQPVVLPPVPVRIGAAPQPRILAPQPMIAGTSVAASVSTAAAPTPYVAAATPVAAAVPLAGTSPVKRYSLPVQPAVPVAPMVVSRRGSSFSSRSQESAEVTPVAAAMVTPVAITGLTTRAVASTGPAAAPATAAAPVSAAAPAVGGIVPLTDAGYHAVIHSGAEADLMRFLRRLIESEGGQVQDEAQLQALAQEIRSMQVGSDGAIEHLRSRLRAAGAGANTWLYLPSAAAVPAGHNGTVAATNVPRPRPVLVAATKSASPPYVSNEAAAQSLSKAQPRIPRQSSSNVSARLARAGFGVPASAAA
eukprot:TRINITY_DN5102_c0_g1_i3.p1 TRINITY_DN5102_c0_g1~~TRINITY_DN5102_c0_g1_i3.p1  ORF type:complete len:515 (+),score=103.01 TRINITY_DN5102_c0_g1_i3:68-1612(+)